MPKKNFSSQTDRPIYVKNMNKFFLTIIILNFVFCVDLFSSFVRNIYINLSILSYICYKYIIVDVH